MNVLSYWLLSKLKEPRESENASEYELKFWEIWKINSTKRFLGNKKYIMEKLSIHDITGVRDD